jgi:hypothetical protein
MIYGVGKECEPGASLIEVRMEKKKNRKDCMKKLGRSAVVPDIYFSVTSSVNDRVLMATRIIDREARNTHRILGWECQRLRL